MDDATLVDAMNLFKPDRALENGELQAFYVERPYAPLDELEIYLRAEKEPVKILFSGHRGSGKSTELRRLSQKLNGDFFTVRVSVAEWVNVSDLNYVDVVLACCVALLREAVENTEYIPLLDQLMRDTLAFLTNEITTDTTIEKTTSGSIGVDIKAFVASLQAKFGKETKTRDTIRTKLYPRVSDLVSQVNMACETIRVQTKRTPLIIVEDIDKADLNHARDLFFNHATTLNSLDCHVIYTFPIPLCYSNEFPERMGDYSERFLLPNVSLTTRDGEPSLRGRLTLREVVTRRVPLTLFEPGTLDSIIELSGGLLRNLIYIVTSAARVSLARKASVITGEAVREVAARMGNEYRRVLLPEHYATLETAHKTKQIVPDDITRQLLENLSLLEYKNDNDWCDVQPVVRKLLDERRSQSTN